MSAPALGADNVRMRIEVAGSCAPREVHRCLLALAPGATVADALLASGWTERLAALPADSWTVGVWGKVRPLDTTLRDLDRVEIWRGLKVDPKEARRQRYRKQAHAKR
jgi:putative ubiquitin-RnfH superfamily antitoxin RatB of RatAB toxin-antitoxin module